MPGKTTSELEATNISSHGILLFSNREELFLSYHDFPWFKEAPVGKILHVEEPSPGHYYWPDLDIDLGIETIKHPEQFLSKQKHSRNVLFFVIPYAPNVSIN